MNELETEKVKMKIISEIDKKKNEIIAHQDAIG